MRLLAPAALLASVLAMTAAAADLTVTATYRERIATPSGSTLAAAILDTARADAPAVEVARAEKKVAGGPPFTLVIPHDPAARDPRGRYVVRAELRLPDGALFFTTDTRIAAPAETARVEILMVKASGAAAPQPAAPGPVAPGPAAPGRVAPGSADLKPADLVGPSWALVEIAGAAPPKGAKAHLLFDRNGRLSGHGGCNRLGAAYIARSDGAFLAGFAFSTMMACPEPMMSLERRVHAALTAARAWSLAGDRLTLAAADGAPVAVWEKRPAR